MIREKIKEKLSLCVHQYDKKKKKEMEVWGGNKFFFKSEG